MRVPKPKKVVFGMVSAVLRVPGYPRTLENTLFRGFWAVLTLFRAPFWRVPKPKTVVFGMVSAVLRV